MDDDLLTQIRKNFDHDYWANDKFIKALLEMTTPPEKAIKIQSHILFAWDVWLARLLKEDLSGFTNPNPSYSLLECREKLDSLFEKWKNYLSKLKAEDLKEAIVYQNTKGKRFEHKIQNILMHVNMHSQYHRGQLALLVSQEGGNRPTTDFGAYIFEIGEAKSL